MREGEEGLWRCRGGGEGRRDCGGEGRRDCGGEGSMDTKCVKLGKYELCYLNSIISVEIKNYLMQYRN